jgi:RNase P subunit RPR2
MASCNYCDTFILFGGVQDGELRFCNNDCAENAAFMQWAAQISAEEVLEVAREIHHGNCPSCQKFGPVEIYQSHRIWSALVITNFSTQTHVTCRSCARKEQFKDSLYCLFLGWWGIPWGIFGTPYYLVKNAIHFFGSKRPGPSEELRQHAQLILASAYAEQLAQEEEGLPPVLEDSP